MDEELRRLERIFHESGTIEDEARLLRERLRVGILNQRQIEIASYLEYPAARLIIKTPLTICSILDETSTPSDIAESWVEALDLGGLPSQQDEGFDVVFAAALSAASAVVERCGSCSLHSARIPSTSETLQHVEETLQYALEAAIKGFGNRESPMDYGYNGGILQALAAQYQQTAIHYAVYCIYSLCEALDGYLLHIKEEMHGNVRMSFYNALEFFPYERDMLCRRIGEQLVPWLLSEWPPTPRRFVELNFDVEL